MIEEIRKRPLARPLFLWIIGILIYVSCPLRELSLAIGGVGAVVWLLLWLFAGESLKEMRYCDRWLWGAVLAWLVISLSVAVSYYRDLRTGFVVETVSPLRTVAREAQRALVDRFDRLRLSEEEKSVAATLTLGYSRSMSWEVKKRFSLTGVSHILSVSGFHVVVVCGFLSFFCACLPKSGIGRWLRYVLLMTGLWVYIFITGLAPPSVRSGLMLSFYLTGRLSGRLTDGYNTLAAAAFCMLVYDPFYLFDIGFQLSYLAVFFIMFLAPRIGGAIEVRNPLLAYPWEWITVSLAAQAGTTLLCFHYFSQFPLVFLLANPPVSFCSTLLLPLAFLWLCYPENVWGYEWIQMGVEGLVHGMVWLVEALSEFPYATLVARLDAVETAMGYVALVLFLVYLRFRKPKVLLGALAVCLSLSLRLLIGYFV